MLPLWPHNVVAQGRNSTQELASISQPRHRHRRHSLLAFSKPPFATIVYHRKNSFLKQTMHHMIHSGQWDCRTSTNFAFDPTQFLFWIKTLPISLLNKKYCRFLFWIKTLPTPFSWQPMASFAVRKSLSRAPRPLIWVILRQATLATQEGPQPYTIGTMMMIKRIFYPHPFIWYIQGVFLNWHPPKKLKYVKPRLGEFTLT